jgi:glycosyltransferase involved in cell wall biosynthesis
LDAVIMAAHQAGLANGQIDLLLMGDGIEAPRLKALVDRLGAANIRFGGRVGTHEIADVFAAADCLVMHLADQPLFDVTIPSKTQFYMAMGRPILAGVKGEAASLLDQCGGAIVVGPENVEALCSAMLELAGRSDAVRRQMGQSARRWYDDNLSFERGIQQTLEVLESMLVRKRS